MSWEEAAEWTEHIDAAFKRWWDAQMFADVPHVAAKRDMECAYRDGFERAWRDAYERFGKARGSDE